MKIWQHTCECVAKYNLGNTALVYEAQMNLYPKGVLKYLNCCIQFNMMSFSLHLPLVELQ